MHLSSQVVVETLMFKHTRLLNVMSTVFWKGAGMGFASFKWMTADLTGIGDYRLGQTSIAASERVAILEIIHLCTTR